MPRKEKVQKQPFAKFTGKRLCQSLFFNKVAGLKPATLLKKRLWHWCFPVNFVKFLRTPFSQNTSWRQLLKVEGSLSRHVTVGLQFLLLGAAALSFSGKLLQNSHKKRFKKFVKRRERKCSFIVKVCLNSQINILKLNLGQ